MKPLLAAFLFTATLAAQSPAPANEQWLLTADFYGAIRYFRIQTDRHDPAHLTGTFNGTNLIGTQSGNHLLLSGTGSDSGKASVDATLQNETLRGTLTFNNPNSPPLISPFTATLIKPLPVVTAKTHEFTPTAFYRQYSSLNKPVLTIHPGDTVHTTTVDAGGNDAQNIKRIAGGNPQTGPFFIENANPGDTIAIHLDRIRLNRDTAGSDDQLVQSALSPGLAIRTRDNNANVNWKLDLSSMTGNPEPSGDHLKSLNIPLHPMLGCIATAVPPSDAPPPTGDSGYYGGNLDFNEIAEGVTVYLPVSVPGALLYLGDGHALQGDGELNGNALETSLDVTFTVQLIQNKRLGFPRVETPTHIITLGYAGYLDEAMRDATDRMAGWLANDYKLTPSEIGIFLGAAAQYRITEVADRNSGVALRIDKTVLRNLTQ